MLILIPNIVTYLTRKVYLNQAKQIFDRTPNIEGETKQLIVKMGSEIEKYRWTHSWPGKIFNPSNSGPRINSAPPLFVARPRATENRYLH